MRFFIPIFILLMLLVRTAFSSEEKYRVVAQKQNGDEVISTSNEVAVKRELKIYIPNAFSPDNDGVNDVFYPSVKNVVAFSMMIYNRWGELVFESNDINIGWNGTFKGKQASQDAYVYLIKVKSSSPGSDSVFNGTVSLIR